MAGAKKPTELLTDEHKAVLQKLTALEKVFGNLDKKEQISAELRELISFFKTDFWVHFTKEEEALFPEMETFSPRNDGPLAGMLREHEDLRQINDDIQKATSDYLGGTASEATVRTLREQGMHFIGALREHIEKEDGMLFGMAEMHLSPGQMEKIAGLFQKIDAAEGKVSGGIEDRGQTVIDALRARRSCKDYLPNPLSPAILSELVDIARYSPAGANKNAWRFIIITQRHTLNRLSEIAGTCSWLASAPAAIAVTIDPASTRYWLEDSSVAAYTLWLAAEARGLGAAWATMHQSDNSAESERRQGLAREVLDIPEQLNIPMVMGLGYRKSPPAERKLTELKELIFWENYPIE